MAQAARLTKSRKGKRTAVSWAVRSILPGTLPKPKAMALAR